MKECSTCGVLKSLDDFAKHSGFSDGRRKHCKKCVNGQYSHEQSRMWAIRKYGVTPDLYQRMLADQEGRCAICLCAFGKTPHVDHDHVTGVARSLLCGECNLGLGKFRDNPEFLMSAARYLERHRA